jgi:hypothetical protein
MADIEQFRRDALEIINAVIREHNNNCIPGDERQFMRLEDITIKLIGKAGKFSKEKYRCVQSRPDDTVSWYESVLSEMLTEGKIDKREYEALCFGT